jgi:hypothetical protein
MVVETTLRVVVYVCHNVFNTLYIKLFSAVPLFAFLMSLSYSRNHLFLCSYLLSQKSKLNVTFDWQVGTLPHSVVNVFLETRFWPGGYFLLTHWKTVVISDKNTSGIYLVRSFHVLHFTFVSTNQDRPLLLTRVYVFEMDRMRPCDTLHFLFCSYTLRQATKWAWCCLSRCVTIARWQERALFNRFSWSPQRRTYPRFMGS